jgi:hypothetical protein
MNSVPTAAHIDQQMEYHIATTKPEVIVRQHVLMMSVDFRGIGQSPLTSVASVLEDK